MQCSGLRSQLRCRRLDLSSVRFESERSVLLFLAISDRTGRSFQRGPNQRPILKQNSTEPNRTSKWQRERLISAVRRSPKIQSRTNRLAELCSNCVESLATYDRPYDLFGNVYDLYYIACSLSPAPRITGRRGTISASRDRPDSQRRCKTHRSIGPARRLRD